ncbi:ribosome maturation factor RimP [Janibacter sp. G1551]|uniref:ribosome maturation factor RimP n=1 Tax=Janibacter sp. G1551 TaxID=3420440 RepID=UPI003CFC9C9C
MSVQETVRSQIEAPLTDAGLVLESVDVTAAGRRRLVRVAVDRPVAGADGAVTAPTQALTLDEIADATRVVSDVLDESDAMGSQPYTLEVSSPGVDRPLTLPRHHQRNVGRLVTLSFDDAAPVTGRIVEASPDEVTLEIPAAGKTPAARATHPYADITKAVVQVEFNRPDAADDLADDGEFADDDLAGSTDDA